MKTRQERCVNLHVMSRLLSKPVAWRVKVGDEWVLCQTQTEAERKSARDRSRIEPLYTADPLYEAISRIDLLYNPALADMDVADAFSSLSREQARVKGILHQMVRDVLARPRD